MFPSYFLHLEREDGRKVFLLASRKRKKSFNSSYLMTTDPTGPRDREACVGKLFSNLLGTEFIICGKERQDLGAVFYDTNILGFKGPRRMRGK